jgi:putative serine protease PepD
MTETPNDPVNAPEPESVDGSTDHTEPTSDAQPTAPQQPAADSPATQQAAIGEPAPQQTDSQPAREQPMAQQRAAQQPATEQPMAQQPATEQPGQQHSWAAPQTAPQSPQPHQAAQQQPTAAYPTADYGHGAFGQPAQGQPAQGQPAPGQPYGAYAGQQPYAGQPPYVGGPTGPHTNTATGTTDKQNKKRGVGLVVAALAVGALIGGASGAGVMGVFQASQNGSAQPSQSTGAQNITVNNAADATPVTAVAAKASPSVVTISVRGNQEAGSGSGVVLTADGYVLTNTHVVTLDGEIANPKIQVQDNDGKLYSAKVIGTDPIVDLAVIKLENASGMTPATFADSSKLNVGDRAVAIGAPLGLSGTVTDGIVSALNRSIQIASSAAPKSSDNGDNGDSGGDGNLWNFDLPGQGQSQQGSANATISLPVIQTDAAINPGNSGGALLNSKGEVIGINVAIANAGGSSVDGSQSGSIGVGFAIPSDLASRVAEELKTNGKATHGLLGATVKDATADASSTTVGALIDSVTQGGPADKAGLKSGDVVTNFNGIPITSPTDLTAQVRALAAGAETKLTYVRDGKPYTVDVKLGELTQ